jgi:hypothetical protein
MRTTPSAVLVLFLFLGCGYRFTPQGGDLPGGARTVWVPTFKNLTADPQLEAQFTDALRQELSRVGREGGEASDVTAIGEVTQVAVGLPIILDTRGAQITQVASYRVSATAMVRLMRNGEKLAETTVTGSEDFLPGAGEAAILETEANRRTALRRLARSLMRQVVENLAAGF